MEPCIQAVHITKKFPGVLALNDISIDFYPGEVHALLGENGAGKSTLIKILSGVYTATEGKVMLNGREMYFQSPRQALDAGISVIHQELSIANDLTVAENIYLGAEPRQKNGVFVDKKKMIADAQAVLDFMKVNIKATDLARDLTAAQQQMAEIAKIIVKNSKVVIMDEPTSSLSEHEIAALFEQIRMLKEKNVAVIYISHRMKEIFEMCDRATVLRDGCFVSTCMIKDVTESLLRQTLSEHILFRVSGRNTWHIRPYRRGTHRGYGNDIRRAQGGFWKNIRKRQGSKLQKPKRRHSSKNRHGDRGQAADGAYACRNGQTQYSAAQPDEAP